MTKEKERPRVIAVCISKKRGTAKTNVGVGRLIPGVGLDGDGHAGYAPVRKDGTAVPRHVSLLANESADKARTQGLDVKPGDFAENLATVGIHLPSLPVGSRLRIGTEAVLRVTQIGKECHQGCSIFERLGDCVMPREGIFAEVLQGGTVRVGDEILVLDER